MMRFSLVAPFFFLGSAKATVDPDWSRAARLPKSISGKTRNRANIYLLAPPALRKSVDRGNTHALEYPVALTMLFPYEALNRLLKKSPGLSSELTQLLAVSEESLTGPREDSAFLEKIYSYLGLARYPTGNHVAPYAVPIAPADRKTQYMGATFTEKKGAKGITFSCAACHSETLFGKTVLGLPNKTPKANNLFFYTSMILPRIPSKLFRRLTRATQAEVDLFDEMKYALRFVGTKRPLHRSLDTSLAQVALSLAKRSLDEDATRDTTLPSRPNRLENVAADSKPMPWWNLKFKTRWLSDGSIVEGNPVLTNFLWNEIGRGTSLKLLEGWLANNDQKVKDLTAAVFATKPPKFSDFFPVSEERLERAKRGEKLFIKHCQSCHGEYRKAWSSKEARNLPAAQQYETQAVHYHEQTPVIDVGTDILRYEGMSAFADRLNKLKISKAMKTIVEPQKGYVPPPLVGIWARWPYLHNNSIPSLCALLSPSDDRPAKFYTGKALVASLHFDEVCNGFPLKDVPQEWKDDRDSLFDTTKEGLRNTGHDFPRVQDRGGALSRKQTLELIAFLQSL